jgi:hypothetical protein
MRKIFILLFLILSTSHVLFAQYYITLNKSNTYHYKNFYLIDIPLHAEGFHLNLFVQDPYSLVPAKAYYNISYNRDSYGETLFQRFDTVFISHNKQIGKIGLELNMLQQNITEYIASSEGSAEYNSYKDTLVDMDYRFSQYQQLHKQIRKDSVLIYYVESGGGRPCCYSDSVYENIKKHNLKDFTLAFEKEHHVKVGEILSEQLGNEGEATIYFTLSGLSEKQKLQFFYERSNSLPSDKSKKEKQELFIIYAPFWIAKNQLRSPVKTWGN